MTLLARDQATPLADRGSSGTEARLEPGAPGASRSKPSRVDVAALTGAAVAIWAGTIVLARTWALYLDATGHQLILFTPPLLGGYRTQLPERFWLPVVAAVGSVLVLPAVARGLRWVNAVLITTVLAALWWVALASVDGWAGFTQGLEWDRDYSATVSRVSAQPLQWLRDFVSSVPGETIQVRAHPPGFPFVMGLLDRLGVGGQTVAVVVIVAVALSSIAAVAIAVRELAGPDVARRVLPFLALAPMASWMIISVDALYTGVAAWMVTLFVLATGRTGRRSVLLAVGAGVLAASSVLLSYGLVLMAGFVVLVSLHRRRGRPLVIAGVTAGLLIAALAPLGYWWPAGLDATRTAYDAFGLDRPYTFSLLSNLAALALVIGPAAFVGLTRLRDRRLWVLSGGGVLAIVLADMSGLSKLEVERIWLPFAVWLMVATAALGRELAQTRAWLAVQASAALVLTALISTYW